jgi:primosomal protein N' (replication factor Y)
MSSPSSCLACGDTALQTKGFGTEKIEEEIKMFFPDAKVARMDHDTTKTKNSHEKIITEFEQKNIDILIGTQMISKGLDFENVRVVGIMNADNLLNFPDFRAYERSYQLMVQVSGRAGRKGKQGKVVIQTADTQNIIIKSVVNNDYNMMVRHQLLERKNFKYPPYYRLIKITLKHKNFYKVDKSSEVLGDYLKQVFGERVLGPEFPLINRIQNWYLKDILIKIEKEKSLKAARDIIITGINRLKNVKEYSGIQININIDPM